MRPTYSNEGKEIGVELEGVQEISAALEAVKDFIKYNDYPGDFGLRSDLNDTLNSIGVDVVARNYACWEPTFAVKGLHKASIVFGALQEKAARHRQDFLAAEFAQGMLDSFKASESNEIGYIVANRQPAE